ncbi:MAG: cytochrome b/b6 domain-containing protein [Alphaproteobacteria bacterium]|nr:cytochrome b/b6 domain-containing protein [Alphaproteobacteria bacterium]
MSQDYHKSFKAIHWVTALIILGLLSVGFFMTGMEYSQDKIQIYNLHKSFGLLILILLAARILVLIVKGRPKPLPTHKKWEKGLSHLIHGLLYLALIAMPVSGWVMSSAGDFPISFFGLDVPDITGKNKDLFELSREAHEIIAFGLIAIIGLHFLGAMKHHFIDRDETLRRMTTQNLGLKGGLLLGFVLTLLFLPALYFVGLEILHEQMEENLETPAIVKTAELEPTEAVRSIPDVTSWSILEDQSYVSFTAKQYGAEFSGKFSGINGPIFFDPENLPDSSVHVKIPVSTIETGSADRDQHALLEDWFYKEKFPYIVFKTISFEKLEEKNMFLAKGELSIRGVSKEIELPFSLEIDRENQEQHAVMKAKIDLSRLDFGVGQGQWQSTESISDDVELSIILKAQSLK